MEFWVRNFDTIVGFDSMASSRGQGSTSLIKRGGRAPDTATIAHLHDQSTTSGNRRHHRPHTQATDSCVLPIERAELH